MIACETMFDTVNAIYGDDPVAGAIYDTIDAVAIVHVLQMAPLRDNHGLDAQTPLPKTIVVMLDITDGRTSFSMFDQNGCAYLHLGPLPRDLTEAFIGLAGALPPFTGGPIEKLQEAPKGPSI